jgi:hypothetical protein
MTAHGEGETPLQRARATVRGVYRAGGSVALVTADNSGRRDVPFLELQAGSAPEWINTLAVDGRAESPAQGWRRAMAMLEERRDPVREVVWISDFNSSLPDTFQAPPKGVRVLRVNVGNDRPRANISVESARVLEPLPGPGQLVEMAVSLRSHSGVAGDCTLVSVTLGDRKVAEGRVTLPAEGVVVHHFTLRLSEAGERPFTVYVKSDDALTWDDRYYGVVAVHQPSPVLVAGEDLSAMRNLELALKARRGGEVVVRQGFPAQEQLEGYDVLILVAPSSISPERGRRVASFVERGGGLWLIAGETMVPASWNRTLLDALGTGEAADLIAQGGRGSGWSITNPDHPVFRGLWGEAAQIKLPRTLKLVRTHPSAATQVLVRTDGGEPLLLEQDVGDGRVWWMTTGVSRGWGDIHVSGMFAPLTTRAVEYLATADNGAAAPAVCGRPLVWHQRNGLDGATVSGPLGEPLTVNTALLGRLGASVDETRWPGHYRLETASGRIRWGAVNVARSESRLESDETGFPGESVEALSERQIAEELTRRRRGRELAGGLLVAALVLLLTESILARAGRSAETKGNEAKA